jgi:hypothetical protein
MTITINIDLEKPCPRCGKKGSVNNSLCLNCISKGIKAGEFDHILNPIKPVKK